LTMNTYTDPRLLDVAGALNALPLLPLYDRPQSERQRATGTNDASPLVPTLVPTPGNSATGVPLADKTTGNRAEVGTAVSGGNVERCTSESIRVKQRANGLEPSTFSLEG